MSRRMRSGSVASHGRGPTEAPWKTPNSSGMGAGYSRPDGSLTSAAPYFRQDPGAQRRRIGVHDPGERRCRVEAEPPPGVIRATTLRCESWPERDVPVGEPSGLKPWPKGIAFDR